MKKFTLGVICLMFFSCGNDIKINNRISIQNWNNEGFSLNYNHDEYWLGIVLPNITKYDVQRNYLLLQRQGLDKEFEYFIINLDSINYPKSLDYKGLSKEKFNHKTDSLGLTYDFISL